MFHHKRDQSKSRVGYTKDCSSVNNNSTFYNVTLAIGTNVSLVQLWRLRRSIGMWMHFACGEFCRDKFWSFVVWRTRNSSGRRLEETKGRVRTSHYYSNTEPTARHSHGRRSSKAKQRQLQRLASAMASFTLERLAVVTFWGLFHL